MRLEFTLAAKADVDDISLSIALDNPNAADRMIDLLSERTGQVAMFPQSGSLRPEIGSEVRCLPCKDYLILYRLTDERVEIVRIVHGARDKSALL
jgi:toxin ParE1/3/4